MKNRFYQKMKQHDIPWIALLLIFAPFFSEAQCTSKCCGTSVSEVYNWYNGTCTYGLIEAKRDASLCCNGYNTAKSFPGLIYITWNQIGSIYYTYYIALPGTYELDFSFNTCSNYPVFIEDKHTITIGPRPPSTTYYQDVDGDGFGNPNAPLTTCIAPAGYVTNNSDCNDAAKLYTDSDKDGFGVGSPIPCDGAMNNDDCNDGNKNIYPNAPEVCGNNVDENCNGMADDVCPAHTWYLDADGDGFYIATRQAEESPGEGWTDVFPVHGEGDCNDIPSEGGAAINRLATELCGNSKDDNCNFEVDEGCIIWYADGDNDNFYRQQLANTSPGAGWTDEQPADTREDCNDEDEDIFPGNPEMCDGKDNNCDGLVDDDDAELCTEIQAQVNALGDEVADHEQTLANLKQSLIDLDNITKEIKKPKGFRWEMYQQIGPIIDGVNLWANVAQTIIAAFAPAGGAAQDMTDLSLNILQTGVNICIGDKDGAARNAAGAAAVARGLTKELNVFEQKGFKWLGVYGNFLGVIDAYDATIDNPSTFLELQEELFENLQSIKSSADETQRLTEQIQKELAGLQTTFTEVRNYYDLNCGNSGKWDLTEVLIANDNTAKMSAYPNPFSDQLNIEFALPRDTRAKLEVFNATGQLLAVLLDGDVKAFELHKLQYRPNGVNHGLIFYRLQTETETFYEKAVMMK